MADKTKPSKKPRFIKPLNILKQKVGIGGIDEMLLVKSQEYIEKIEVDYIPYAEQYLRDFSAQIREAKQNGLASNSEKMIAAIMQLKASGGMFRYHLISEVSEIALRFLEDIDAAKANPDTFEVLAAHENTLRVIVSNKLKGGGGKEGFALIQELDQACKRYFEKYKKEPPPSK